MSNKLKALETKFEELREKFRIKQSQLATSAGETILEEMNSVKKNLKLSGLRIDFRREEDSFYIVLDVKTNEDADWDGYEDVDVKDPSDLLGRLKEGVLELAYYLRWDDRNITV